MVGVRYVDAADPGPPSGRPWVVVVDDEASILDVLQTALQEAGFTVTCVRHPDRVMDEMARCEPSIFLIDITLPSRNGIDLARELRSNGFGGAPMIAISASHIMTRAARHSGLFQVVLDKPLDLDTLLESIAQALGSSPSA